MQNSVRMHKHSKVGPRYFGPFLVLERVGKVAYKLDLPNEVQIHLVFHVSLLKEAPKLPGKIISLPVDSQFHLTLVSVLDLRLVKRGNRAAMKVLVQWVGQTKQNATWEIFGRHEVTFSRVR